MRWVLVLALAACSGVPTGQSCLQDSDCGSGGVCANTEECEAASDVQRVTVHWTVNGATADATSCAPAPYLTIMVVNHTDGSDNFGGSSAWGPVACTEGGFVFDKLPVDYNIIELMANDAGGGGEGDVPSGGGDVAIDMGYPVP